MLRISIASLILLAACGSDDKANPDAGTQSDAGNTATVKKVTCPSGTLPSISSTTGNNNSYTPSSVTISVGQVVEFKMASAHNVVPSDTGKTDPGLNVGFGEDVCLMFTQAGTYGFKCAPHSFKGTVVVQ